MKIYRRTNWVGKLGLVLFLFAALSFVTACDVNWVGQATSILNVLVPAIEGALALLLTFGLRIPPSLSSQIMVAANAVIADLNDIVKPLLDAYNAAPDADKATVMEKIETALKVTANRFPDILNALHVENPAVQAKLEAIFGALQSEILALLNIIPVANGKVTLSAFEADGGHLPLNSAQFKHHFETIFKAKTGDASVDNVLKHAKVFEK